MTGGDKKEGGLFPDRVHFFLFWLYVGLFVNQGILITASKNADGTYSYNTTTIVLLTEVVKLLIAMCLYLKEHNWNVVELWSVIRGSGTLMALYLIPAFLYCLYNNLAFHNLQHFDPTTYFLLLNFRTVTTGVIFQFLFQKKLSSRQWMALVILTLGCIIKQVRFDDLSKIKIQLDIYLLLILVQVFCSCFAGVYNEFLLKDTGANVHIQVQNIFMYVNSIFMNIGFLFFAGTLQTAFTYEAIKSIIKPGVLAIVLNNGVAGVTTSLFLKKFNSILKTFAGAIELLLTAALSWWLFGVAIDAPMLISIVLVSLALYLYSQQPVVNKGTLPTTMSSPEQKRHLSGVDITRQLPVSKPVSN